MAMHTSIWQVEGNEIKSVSRARLDREARLEEWLVRDLSILGLDLLLVGRQTVTDLRGRIDLLAVDSDGNVVVIELKKDRTPREVIAQTLEYAAFVSEMDFLQLDESCHKYCGKPLAEAFSDHFKGPAPDTWNDSHQAIIVASEFDESSSRILDYLQEYGQIAISAIFFNFYTLADGTELLARSWSRAPEPVSEKSESRRRVPWTGYWFVNADPGTLREWDDCVKYGFVCADGGRQWTTQLDRLSIGDSIYAYAIACGYVGIGTIVSDRMLAKEFISPSTSKPLKNETLKSKGLIEADDPDSGAYCVGVRWRNTVPIKDALWEQGLFANQAIACKLRNPETLKFLAARLGTIDDDAN